MLGAKLYVQNCSSRRWRELSKWGQLIPEIRFGAFEDKPVQHVSQNPNEEFWIN